MLPARLRPAALLEVREAWGWYEAEPEHIEVIAVFHTSRNPAVWQERV